MQCGPVLTCQQLTRHGGVLCWPQHACWHGRQARLGIRWHVLLTWHTVQGVAPVRQPGRPGAHSHMVLLVLVFCLALLLVSLCCLQARIMRQDWSWNRPALDYVELYYSCTKE